MILYLLVYLIKNRYIFLIGVILDGLDQIVKLAVHFQDACMEYAMDTQILVLVIRVGVVTYVMNLFVVKAAI